MFSSEVYHVKDQAMSTLVISSPVRQSYIWP